MLAESRWISHLYTSYICSGHGRDDGHFRVFQQCAICKIGLILDKSAHHLQSQVRNLVQLSGMILECSKAFRRVALAPNMGCLDVCICNATKWTGTKGTWMSIVSVHLLQKHRSFPLLRGIAWPFTISAVVLQSRAYYWWWLPVPSGWDLTATPACQDAEGDARKRHAPNGFRFFQVLWNIHVRIL